MKAHPEYSFKLWTEDDLKGEEFINKDIILDKSLNPGLRADALRLEILYKYGGIYIDIDMALVQPLDTMFSKFNADFMIGVSYTSAFEVNNAMVASDIGHPFLNHLIERLKHGFKEQITKI